MEKRRFRNFFFLFAKTLGLWDINSLTLSSLTRD